MPHLRHTRSGSSRLPPQKEWNKTGLARRRGARVQRGDAHDEAAAEDSWRRSIALLLSHAAM